MSRESVHKQFGEQTVEMVPEGTADSQEKETSCGERAHEFRDELLSPEGWNEVLETFASTMRLAVAITDRDGRLLGKCHNPQPVWSRLRAAIPDIMGGCPFCLAPAASCTAVEDALKTGGVATVQDAAGLTHVAVPLTLCGQPLGALIAGQVFSQYPEPLPLQRVARTLGISGPQLWHEAIQQVPLTRTTLQLYANLLMSLGQAFLGQRYAAVLERELARANQRYRLFFDGVQNYALITMDRSGCITSWSGGAERLFGYRAAEIIGENAACLVLSENIPGQILQQLMLEADRLGWVEREVWRVRKDGTRFLGAGVLASLGKGADREYGSLVQDVTALRRSEQDLQQAQKLEGIGVLAGGIAHDFNNLLTGIMGGLNLAKTSLHPEDPAFRMVEIAEQSGERATELVSQLLAYAGKGQFVISRLNLSTLIAEMPPLITASIPKTVELKLLLTPDLAWIEADASQIRQVVMNLIINAAESIGPEGGMVRVLTGVSNSGTDIFMEVRDSGAGMNEETKAKMFDPFFTTKFTGRGLGLAAVSGIVRGHKGTMRVDSILGQGTTITVDFPAVQAPDIAEVDIPPTIIQPTTGTILVVDDEAILRTLAGVILKKFGYSVLFAKDGREAVDIFQQHATEIAAVLLDMTMPVMGGHQALRLIREIRPEVPVVISSGYSEVFARQELDKDIVAGFIKKPYTAVKLIESIQQVSTSSTPRQ